MEVSRYRCFLLGLPRELLGETPQEIVDLMTARTLSIKEAFDDAICGELVRGTMQAELFNDPSLRGRVHRWMEAGFARFFFIRNFCDGKVDRAARLGVTYGFNDRVATAAALVVIMGSANLYKIGMRLPGINSLLDKHLVHRLAVLLESYGHADFITDPAQYKLKLL